MRKTIQAVLWDMDGPLADSEALVWKHASPCWIVTAWQSAIRMHDYTSPGSRALR